jgi:glyoxylase-like metal-dependent hydrolase (beta-lactamase superfamily II)
VAGGIQALSTPGHTLGHLAFLWPGDGGVLFTGDVALNHGKMTLASIYEDEALGRESLRSLGRFEFETACFAHGAPIVGGAAAAFRRVWG